MEVLRLYDPGRRPASWTEIIRPGQFVAFSKHIDSGGPCDAAGWPFASSGEIACLIFDRLEEARGFCEARVLQAPPVRFDVYDSAGRTNPPLLTIVHPSRIATLEGNPRGMRMRKRAAIVLTAGAFALFWFDYRTSAGLLILPTILGINMILIAARLIQLNASHAHAERQRLDRLAQASAEPSEGEPPSTPNS
jgi:hypothetical protein